MRKYICIIFLSIISLAISSQVPQRPNPPHLVNNYLSNPSDFLSESETNQLEQKLAQFSRETSNQICVVIMPDFNGYEPMELATQIGREWGIGQKDSKNGIVILINPVGQNGRKRQLAIAVGYGLEGAIPDLATKHIREKLIQPDFKQRLYFSGLNKGIDELMGLAKGEISVKNYNANDFSKKDVFIYVILFFVIIIIISRFTNRSRTYHHGGTIGGGFWGIGGFGGGGSSWGGNDRGSSSSDFGGFGGGDFGGGGSSGDW
jgi:uncharacterized protein